MGFSEEKSTNSYGVMLLCELEMFDRQMAKGLFHPDKGIWQDICRNSSIYSREVDLAHKSSSKPQMLLQDGNVSDGFSVFGQLHNQQNAFTTPTALSLPLSISTVRWLNGAAAINPNSMLHLPTTPIKKQRSNMPYILKAQMKGLFRLETIGTCFRCPPVFDPRLMFLLFLLLFLLHLPSPLLFSNFLRLLRGTINLPSPLLHSSSDPFFSLFLPFLFSLQ